MADDHVHDLRLLPQVDQMIEFAAPCCHKFLLTALPADWVSHSWDEVVTRVAHSLGGQHRGAWEQYFTPGWPEPDPADPPSTDQQDLTRQR